jgi:DNA-binding PadR family transcriptional regulator
MLKAGLLKGRWGVSATGRRVRTYELTPRGETHLNEERSKFERMLEGIHLVLSPVKS